MGTERDELGPFEVPGNSKVRLFKPRSQKSSFELKQNFFVAQAFSIYFRGPQTHSRVVLTLLGVKSCCSPSKPDDDARFVSPQLAKRHLAKKDNI